MKKELLISAKFDTSDFDKSVESMQKKLKEMYAPSDAVRMQKTSQMLQQAGYGSLAGAPGPGDVQGKQNEYKRNLDKMIREEKTALEAKVKVLDQEKGSYAKISEEYQKVIKSGKEDLKLKEQLKAAQESLTKAKDEELQKETEVVALVKEKQRLGIRGGAAQGFVSGYQGGGMAGGIRGAAEGAGEAMGMSALGVAALGGLAATAAVLAKNLFNDFVNRPTAVIAAQGSAIAGTMGKNLSQAQTGEFAFEGMFGEERERAGEKAKSAVFRQKISDIFSLGIFTARGRAAWSDPEKYNAMNAQLESESFQSALQGEKETSPMKKTAIEKLQRDMYRNLSSERQMGLGTQEMLGPGGFLQQALNSGFMEDMAVQAAKGIAQAGGSTAMQRQATTALQAERGLNLTNSTGVLGALSGAMGGAEASKQSMIDIFSTAQQIGLDKSKFAEENRKFMQNVAEVVSRGGMTSEYGAAKVGEQMGAFATGTTTMRGLDDAKAAYQAYSQATTATAGYTGAMNAAVMMKQFPDLIKSIGKDPAMMQLMMSMAPEELDPNSPTIKSMLTQYNKQNPNEQKTANQLIDRIQQMHIAQSERYAPGESNVPKTIAKDMIDFIKKGGNMAEYQPQGAANEGFAQYMGRLRMVPQYQNLSRQQLERVALGQAEQEAEQMPEGKTRIEELRKMKKTETVAALEGKGYRDEEKVLASQADAADIALKKLSDSIGSFTAAAVANSSKLVSGSQELDKIDKLHTELLKTSANKAAYVADIEARMSANITERRDPWFGISQGQRGIVERMIQKQAGSP